MKRNIFANVLLAVLGIALLLSANLMSQKSGKKNDLDEKVGTFLEKREGAWRDLNIPTSDGKVLYDLIIKNKYKKALEIGTSTGYSTIFIAWALSKTGGKVITIEIDPERYREALANFKEAGLSEYIDARLADAHDLVKEIKGSFDFVFCDADKDGTKITSSPCILNLRKAGAIRPTMSHPGNGVWEQGRVNFTIT